MDSGYSNCIENVIGDPEDLATRAYVNSAFCDIYPKDSQDYQNCVNSTLDPAFEGMQRYILTFQALKYGFTLFSLGWAPAIVGCSFTGVCGAALTVVDVGIELYRLVNGDQSLGKTLLNIGTIALENLVAAGIGKLISAGFRALKNAYTAARTGSNAVSEIQIGLIRSKEQLVLSHVRAMEVSLHSADNYTTPGNAAFFWSGRSSVGDDDYVYAGPEEAARIARERGGTTLEITMDSHGIPQASWGGKDMDWDPAEVPWDAIKDQVDAVWRRVSLAYARNASGEVRIFLGESVLPNSVWKTVECEALLKNPQVTKIIVIGLLSREEERVISNKSQC